MKASELSPGQAATIRRLCGTGALQDRLRGLGFFPGETLVLEFKTTLGGPWIFRIGVMKVALRVQEADRIELERAT